MYKVKYDDINNNLKFVVKVFVFIYFNDGVIFWMLLLFFFVYLILVLYNFILEIYNNSVLKYNL